MNDDVLELTRLLEREAWEWGKLKMSIGMGDPMSTTYLARELTRGSGPDSPIAAFQLRLPSFEVDGQIEYTVTVTRGKAL